MQDSTDLFVVAVSVVIFKENQLLMMKRSPNKKAGPNLWETLSGRVHHGEDPYEAAKREVVEECQLLVEIQPKPFDLYMTTRLKKPMLLLIYKASYLSGQVVLSDEHSEYKWGSPEEFASLTRLDRLAESVKKAAIS